MTRHKWRLPLNLRISASENFNVSMSYKFSGNLLSLKMRFIFPKAIEHPVANWLSVLY